MTRAAFGCLLGVKIFIAALGARADTAVALPAPAKDWPRPGFPRAIAALMCMGSAIAVVAVTAFAAATPPAFADAVSGRPRQFSN